MMQQGQHCACHVMAKSYTQLEWEAHKSLIQVLFISQRRTLKQIQEHLCSQKLMHVNKNQLDYRMRTWGFSKNLKERDYLQVQMSGPIVVTPVYLNGVRQPDKKIRKGVRRSRANVLNSVQTQPDHMPMYSMHAITGALPPEDTYQSVRPAKRRRLAASGNTLTVDEEDDHPLPESLFDDMDLQFDFEGSQSFSSTSTYSNISISPTSTLSFVREISPERSLYDEIILPLLAIAPTPPDAVSASRETSFVRDFIRSILCIVGNRFSYEYTTEYHRVLDLLKAHHSSLVSLLTSIISLGPPDPRIRWRGLPELIRLGDGLIYITLYLHPSKFNATVLSYLLSSGCRPSLETMSKINNCNDKAKLSCINRYSDLSWRAYLPFHRGNAALLEALLEAKAPGTENSIVAESDEGLKAIFFDAMTHRSPKVAEISLAALNLSADSESEVLVEACAAGLDLAVRRLLELGMNVNKPHVTYGPEDDSLRATLAGVTTPLAAALQHGHKGVAERLLLAGADPNLGCRPDIELRTLGFPGAKTSDAILHNITPIEIAILYGELYDVEFFKRLVRYGAKFSRPDRAWVLALCNLPSISCEFKYIASILNSPTPVNTNLSCPGPITKSPYRNLVILTKGGGIYELARINTSRPTNFLATESLDLVSLLDHAIRYKESSNWDALFGHIATLNIDKGRQVLDTVFELLEQYPSKPHVFKQRGTVPGVRLIYEAKRYRLKDRSWSANGLQSIIGAAWNGRLKASELHKFIAEDLPIPAFKIIPQNEFARRIDDILWHSANAPGISLIDCAEFKGNIKLEVHEGLVPLIDLLESYGWDIKTRTQRYKTRRPESLSSSISSDYLGPDHHLGGRGILDILLDREAYCDITKSTLKRIMSSASYSEDIATCVERIKASGGDYNSKNRSDMSESCNAGYTPLSRLVARRDPDITHIEQFLDVRRYGAFDSLFKRCPDRNIGSWRYTPMQIAAFYGNVELVQLLIKSGAFSNEMEHAVTLNMEGIETVEDVIANTNTTALNLAVGMGRSDAVRLLLNDGAWVLPSTIRLAQKNGSCKRLLELLVTARDLQKKADVIQKRLGPLLQSRSKTVRL